MARRPPRQRPAHVLQMIVHNLNEPRRTRSLSEYGHGRESLSILGLEHSPAKTQTPSIR